MESDLSVYPITVFDLDQHYTLITSSDKVAYFCATEKERN